VVRTEGEQGEAPGRRGSETRKKKSTEKGEAQDKLIAALTAHHGYANRGCKKLEPIGSNELARKASVVKASASLFFEKYFHGHATYKALCRRDFSRVLQVLKALNGDFQVEDTYGSVPPGERDRDDE
jgi:hypothetical protein